LIQEHRRVEEARSLRHAAPQAEAARRIGITQPRVNDLLRGRLDKFSIDALIVYLVGAGVPVRIDTSTRKRRRRAA